VTGGGDCPGLNAVIRAVVKSAAKRGWETLGFKGGFEGLRVVLLDPCQHRRDVGVRIDLGRQRQSDDRTDAGNGGQTLADLAGFVRGVQFGVDFADTGVDFVDLLTQEGEHLLGLRRDGDLLFNSREQRHDLSSSLTGDDAELGGVTADRIDQLGSLANQQLARRHAQHTLDGDGLLGQGRKALAGLQSLDEPGVTGSIENHRYFICPEGGGRQHPAGQKER